MWRLVVFFLFSCNGIHALLKAGASKAHYGDCSYTVGIYESGDGNKFIQKCSGAIIGAQFILTAAHCFFNEDLNFRNNFFQVLSGTDDAMSQRRFQEKIEVEEVRVPKLFFQSPEGVELLSNIAVLKLRKPIKFFRTGSPFVKKVFLPENHRTQPILNPIVSGFGLASIRNAEDDGIEFYYEENSQLYFAQADILKMIECQEYFNPEIKKLTFLHICAKVKQRKPGITSGTCERDAGAPLVIYTGQIIGVLSNGPIHCNESVSPGIYTRVLPHNEFIQTAMENNVTDPTIAVITLPSIK